MISYEHLVDVAGRLALEGRIKDERILALEAEAAQLRDRVTALEAEPEPASDDDPPAKDDPQP